MADIIFYNIPHAIQALVETKLPPEVRIKSCSVFEHASSWIDLLNVGIVVCDFETDIEVQKKLGDKLWKNNPQNIVILVSPKRLPPSKITFATRLSGADLVHMEDAGSRLMELILERVKIRELPEEKLRVLVVEDLDSPRDIISAYIESLGAPDVEQASSAQEALERVRDEGKPPISCIVTDMKMPVHDGMTLVRWIRGDIQYAHLPIIMLTAYGTMECLIDALEVGVTGFLVKPPKKTDIQRELARAARIWRRKSEPRLVTGEEFLLFKKAIAVDK